jgi:acetyl-CoA carboxylase carboxyltransferase component
LQLIWVAVKRIENNIRIKLTARERVNYLMDEGSFEEIGMFDAPHD